MALPKRSLAAIICNTFDIELDCSDFYIIYGQTLSYLTKGMSAFEYQKVMKPYCPKGKMSAKTFRLALHRTKYIALDLKLFLLRLSRVKTVTLDLVKELTAELGLYVVDAKRMYNIWKTQSTFRARIKKLVREVHKNDLLLLTHDGLEHYFNTELFVPIYKRIKSICHKRLRFLMKSLNMTRSDFHNELMEKVVHVYYNQVPIMKDKAFLLNYMALAADNYAVNIIKSETSLKRGRLVNIGKDRNGEDRFALLCESENQRFVSNEEDQTSYTDVDTGNDMRRFELQFSVSELLDRYAERSKKHRMMLLLMGQDDEQFTEWLQKRRLCKPSEANSDVQMRVSVEEYNRYVSSFLHVSETKTNVFLLKLRKALALDHKPYALAA